MSNTRNPILALAMAAAAAFLLAACGDSGSSSSTAETASSDYIVKSSDRISTTNAPSVARLPAGEENDEVSETGAAPVKPCELVSAGVASAILGTPVQATTGPLGPTCIYTAPGAKQTITLVVERVSLASLREHARTSTRVGVAGRSGWCLHYGSTSIAVPLADGSVLDVTGPCDTARRFAAHALPRISN